MASSNITMEMETIDAPPTTLPAAPTDVDDSTECQCCYDTFNKSVRSKIECPQCNFNICKACARQYILSTTELPHCMDCKALWPQRFIVKHLNHSFVDNEYKLHRKKLLLDRQVSMLPETMQAVAEACRREEHNKKQYAILDQIKELTQQIRLLKTEKNNNNTHFYSGSSIAESSGRKFILPCPDEDCRGYLSTAYKCELCSCYACPKCLILTGKERHDHTHVCDEELVKTTEFIRNSSKPCPSCGERIIKSSGCDQMWCTNCKSAFSWRTGKIDKGMIHNPHFFQFQQNGGGAVPRNPGDVVCGGLPDNWWRIRGLLRQSLLFKSGEKEYTCECMNHKEPWLSQPCGTAAEEGGWGPMIVPVDLIRDNHVKIEQKFSELFHSLRHINDYTLPRYRTMVRELADHEDVRVEYLMKKINKTVMGTELMRRDKRRNKAIEMMHMYELFVAVGNDLINHLCQFIKPETPAAAPPPTQIVCKEFVHKFIEFDTFIHYINNEFKHISVAYSQKVPQVSCVAPHPYNFDKLYKFNKGDLETSV